MYVRLKTELRDALELVLLPGLAAVLPWPWCFALFKHMARWHWLYRAPSALALQQARLRGFAGGDEAYWLWQRKLVTLVDHADFYLVRTRRVAWMRRHFEVTGSWPLPARAGLLCTFHWGAGMWSLPHAAAAGLKVHAMVAPLDGAHFAGRQVLLAYAKARTAIVAKMLGCATLDVSSSLLPALRALKKNEQLLAVVDVPADQVSTSQSIELLGMRARVPRALLRLAVDQKIPVTIFLVGLNTNTGRRFLRLRQFGIYSDLDVLIRDVFLVLDAAILESPAVWHFWGEAERFFGPETPP
jgi:hypothetical protein